MGALTLLGGIAGLGQGAAHAAGQWMIDQREKERQDALLERERLRQSEMDQRHSETLGLRRELADLKAAQAAGAGRGKPSGIDTIRALMEEPALMAAAGGGSTEGALAFKDVLTKGKNQQVEAGTTLDDEYGEQKVYAPKYQPGQPEKILADGFEMLRRAIGSINPEAADNIAGAAKTYQGMGFADKAAAGDPAGFRGALALAGKGEFSADGSSEATGLPAKGSVAESKAGENKAKAGEHAAHAAKYKADIDKIKADIDAGPTKGQAGRERLNSLLNSMNEYAKDFTLSDEVRADINATRARLSKMINQALDERESGKPAAKADPAKPAEKPKAADDAPPASLLREGIKTRFKNGQSWTLRDGKPVRVN